MYDRALDTFLTVADCGSFTRAAERLFLSSTAVMKQMNALEGRLSLTLFVRTAGGVRLTAAGAVLYREAKALIRRSRQALEAARAAQDAAGHFFRVGTSALNPAKPFMDLWEQVGGQFPAHRLQLVPFTDDHRGILSEVEKLGEKFDFLIGVCDSRAWLDRCRLLELGRYRKMVAVPRGHRLARRKRLTVEDLHGETLMMVQAGDSEANDALRRELTARHPSVRIEDTPPYYDLSVFNRCAETGCLLLTIECWRDVHPGLVTLPVRWDFTIPYGLLYSLDPPEAVTAFVRAVERARRGR